MLSPFSKESEPTDSSAQTAASQLGQVFAVPDKWWGFEAVGREDHPGACVREEAATGDCNLLKGTGAENRRRYHPTEMLIVATPANGLLKNTLFALRPRPFRRHRISNLIPDRVMGRLATEEVERLNTEMLRLFGNQG